MADTSLRYSLDTTSNTNKLISVSKDNAGRPNIRLKWDSAAGKSLYVMKEDSTSKRTDVCTVGIPSAPTQALTFLVYTGVEFSSADGFTSREARVPVEAELEIPLEGQSVRTSGPLLPSRSPKSTTLSLLLTTEATSIVEPRILENCILSHVSGLGNVTLANPVPQRDACGPATVTHFTSDSTVLQQYILQGNSVGSDTAPVTSAVWRTQGYLVAETRLFSAPVYLGYTFTFGLQTNPNGASVRSLGTLYGPGATLRVGRALRFSGGWETDQVFPVLLLTQRTTVGDTTSTVVRRPLPTQTARTWRFKIFFQPVAGYYLRATAQLFDRSFPDYAAVAIVKEIDLGKVIGGLLSSSPSTSPQ